MSEAISKARTTNYLLQIRSTVIYKLFALVSSFLAFPLMIHYLGNESFGVWSTLLTVISWTLFFDLGIGNGLRNKVAELLAKNDHAAVAKYISTGYTLIGFIMVLLLTILFASSFYVPWQQFFNTQSISESKLQGVFVVAMVFICLNIWVGLINAILSAEQKMGAVAFGQMIANVLALICIFILERTTQASLLYLAGTYGVSLVAANLLLSAWYFRSQRSFFPRPHLEKNYVQPLVSIGMQFFVIQFAGLILFATDKILIAQLFGPQYIVQYDAVYKLFSVVTIAYASISAPLWSAYTEAFHRQDMNWIKKMLRKQLVIFAVSVGLIIIMGLCTRTIIALWIGPNMEISIYLIIAMAAFMMVSVWNNVFAIFINGIGRIRLQLYAAIAAMILNIPLAIFFVKYLGFGVNGIVLATTISLLFAAILLPLQSIHILRSQ